MKEFFDRVESFGKKAFHALQVFRPAGIELTMKKVAKLAFFVGAGWLLCKALGNFFIVWRVCRSVEIIASLFAH